MLEFGLSPQEFRARHLEQQIYLRPRALQEQTLQWADFNELLHHLEPDEAAVQLFNNGQLPPRAYIDEGVEFGRPRRRLNQHRLYSLMRNGATLVLNRIESHWLAAKRLCAEVGRFVGQQTLANAYLSFGGKGTFGKHWDTHDVFAIQLIGRKRWQIFAPTFPFPLSHHTSEQRQHECPATPLLDCVLAPGDLLYVPRGWWHQTIPFDEPSLHLSVGAYGPTLMDYLMWAASRHLPRHLLARKGLIDDAASLKDLGEVMRALNQFLLAPQSLAEFKQELTSRERLAGEFNVDVFMDDAGTKLQDSDILRLTSCFAPDNESPDMAVNGARLRLEPVSRAIVRVLSAVPSMCVGELAAKITHVPADAVRAAALDLARYEVVTIVRS